MCVDAVTSYYLQCNKTTFLCCLRVGEEKKEASSLPSDSMAAIIMSAISLQPSGTVLLLFNTSVLA